MRYPNKIQSCILLHDRFGDLESIVNDVRQIFEEQVGLSFNIPEAKPGYYYHLFGQQEDLMIRFEYVDDQVDLSCFEKALDSPITEIYCEDMRQRVATHQAHIIVDIWHGVLGGAAENPKIAAMFDSIGRPRDGATIGQFKKRLEALKLISHIMCSRAPVSAVHWTQSNQLFPAEIFVDFAQKDAGTVFYVHPYLYGYQTDTQGRHMLGVKSFGVEQFLGREVVIKPNNIPWHANHLVICMFMDAALARDGVVTGDHYIFGLDDQSLGYLCIHHDDPDEGKAPEYELVPMWYKEYDFVTDDPEFQQAVSDLGIGIQESQPAPAPPPMSARPSVPRGDGFGRKQV